MARQGETWYNANMMKTFKREPKSESPEQNHERIVALLVRENFEIEKVAINSKGKVFSCNYRDQQVNFRITHSGDVIVSMKEMTIDEHCFCEGQIGERVLSAISAVNNLLNVFDLIHKWVGGAHINYVESFSVTSFMIRFKDAKNNVWKYSFLRGLDTISLISSDQPLRLSYMVQQHSFSSAIRYFAFKKIVQFHGSSKRDLVPNRGNFIY